MLSLLLTALLSYAHAAIELNTKNTILLKSDIVAENTDAAALEIFRLNELRGTRKYPLYLVVDSGGGRIDAGQDFIELVKHVPNLHTITLNAASMASAIVQALPGRRYILQAGTHMYHRAKGSFSGQFETGEVESRLDLGKQLVLILEQTNATRMGMSLAKYKSLVVNELWYVGANAVKAHSADEVVSIKCTPALMREKMTITEDFAVIVLPVEYSKCPLIKSGKLQIQPEQEQK